MNKQNRKSPSSIGIKNKFLIGILAVIGILIIIYVGFSIYFTSHFYFGSSINSINISGDTIPVAQEKVQAEINKYQLNIEGRDGLDEHITKDSIDLKYNVANEIQSLKSLQNPFAFGIEIFNSNDTKGQLSKTYDNAKLDKILQVYLKNDKTIKPKSASLKYVDGKYEIVKEVYGNEISESKLYSVVLDAINNDKTTINLDTLGCYITPKFTSTSQSVIDAQGTMDKYLKAKITYDVNGDETVVNDNLIHNWLYTDKDMNVHISTSKVTDFVQSLAKKYNTVGTTRTFKSSLGTNASVTGGDYGWKINVDSEVSKLISEIKEGSVVTRQPIYSQKGLPRGTVGVGNTYVEVNVLKQTLWFYKDGKLVITSPVVTGNVSKKDGTPDGMYTLLYKEHDTHLKGKGYDVPVKYWMPFNGGIGLHDAWWRDKFGGTIYEKDGSHGCVNLPPKTAETIYNNISAGTPVIIYQ